MGDLAGVVDLDAISHSKVHIGVDPLGGASVAYRDAIRDRYGLNLEVVNHAIDPTLGSRNFGKLQRAAREGDPTAAMFNLEHRTMNDEDRNGQVILVVAISTDRSPFPHVTRLARLHSKGT